MNFQRTTHRNNRKKIPENLAETLQRDSFQQFMYSFQNLRVFGVVKLEYGICLPVQGHLEDI